MASQGLPSRSVTLHVLRIKGVAEAGALATATGFGMEQITSALADLVARGLAEYRDGVLTGWRPTAPGVRHDDAWLCRELEAAGARTALEEAYHSFLALNPELLRACTAWQLVDAGDGSQTPNDHRDASYDAGVVAHLAEIHRRVQPVVLELSRHLPRFGPYRPRLQTALDRVRAGDGDWFTRPLLDSYHQVWFELHQDLLSTLGLDRTTEMPPVDEHSGSSEPR
ncbi:MAG TPA: hypothetical protein VGV93_10955 [Acidimicrobiales bacterium]|nr:hypothetical protein [Acidimicrobiales bacterium]